MSRVLRGRWSMTAWLAVLALLAEFITVVPARAQETPQANRSLVVAAWVKGGAQVRAAAEVALLGTDAQVSAFLATGWSQAQRQDDRDAVAAVIADAGPSLRGSAKVALDADAAGNQNALRDFLNSGWQGPSDIDARVSVNQLMTAGGEQVRQAAQAVLDAGSPKALREFLDSGWQVQWQTDQRLRVNQAMATGGTQVRAAAQRALDAGTPEALEGFLAYGWAVASARDAETATLNDLLAQATAAGQLAAQETQQATGDAARAKEAADAARRAAAEAAAATAAAGGNMAEAERQAMRAATAAQKAAESAQVAVKAAAAASRAARTASTAAARAASLAAKAGRAAAEAYRAAGLAATDASKADAARQAAQQANAIASQARDFATKANQAGQAIQSGMEAIEAAKSAAAHAQAAAAANDDAVRHATAAGGQARAAIAAAKQARDNAQRAIRAAQAAENYLNVAIDAAFRARDAALRAADNAEAAARAAVFAAEHAGEAAHAAQRATEHANAATAAAQAAVDAANQANGVFDAARVADTERLAVSRDEGLETARAALAEYDERQRAADWDIEAANKRDAQTNQLIATAQNPATPRADAVAAAKRAALNLATAQGAWTQQAALAALAGPDELVLAFARTGIAAAAAQDNRVAVMDLAITDNAALATAALTALAGNDAAVAQFLRTQNYPGRFSADRLKVNQILSAATAAGDTTLAQAAQVALDADSLQALRDFLDTGQYTAAHIAQRLRVNQILASPDSGPEVKAAAQMALDGPPPALEQFINTSQFTSAERDHESAAHLAVVGNLLRQINQVAETAVQNALDAQRVAAEARGNAQEAAAYAQQAAESANTAAGYAAQAQAFANQAVASVDKAAAAVQTARSAATRAVTSARSAIRSASWAIASHRQAVDAAKQAHAHALNAYNSAVAAGQSAEAAAAAATAAWTTYSQARGLEIARCHTEYASGPSPDLERLLTGSSGEWYRNCVKNVIADPTELANRAYTNSAFCDIYPSGSQQYQNCVHSVLDPEFKGMQKLVFIAEALKVFIAPMIWVGAVAVVGCVVTIACAAAAGALLTIGGVGINVYKYINGDQTLARTLLNIGVIALESLVLAGIGKLLSVGFQAIKAAYIAAQNGKKAEAALQLAELTRIQKLAATADIRALSVTLESTGKLGPSTMPGGMPPGMFDFYERYGRLYGHPLTREEFVARYWDPAAVSPRSPHGDWRWPPHSGVDPGSAITIDLPKAGDVWDRWGGPWGKFFSPLRPGTTPYPFATRALPPANINDGYFQYRWIRDWDGSLGDIKRSLTAPWFGQRGGAVQVESPFSAEWLIANNFIELVT